jgi:AraC-like DNA-binding protein
MKGTAGLRQSSVGTVRIAAVNSIPAVLEQLGFEPTATLSELGFDIRLFDDPDNVIPFSERGRLIQRCVDKTGCRHFGLLIGQHIGPSSFGIPGFLMQQSTDVGTALRSLVRYLHLHGDGAVIYLDETGETAFLGYGIMHPSVEAVAQIQDAAVAAAFNVMRKLCGPAWSPIKLCFAHSKPEHTRPFRQFFAAPLLYGEERAGVLFSAGWLQAPLRGADPELRALLQKQVDELEDRYADDFAEQVRRVLHSSLLMHQASADHVAALFSIHQRTLHRRLKACGTCFRELADESRFEIARQLLENSAMNLAQIAATLDYADASAFARAFRRQSGSTPSSWRQKHRQANA